MSFRQGARQFFERGGAPTPPLPYDAEVEYLESTGTQWIDTSIVAREGLLVECIGNITMWTSNGRLFGCTSGGRGREFEVQTGRLDTSQVYVGSAYSVSYATSIPVGQSSHVFDLDTTAGAKSFSVDGVVQQTWSTSIGVPLTNIFLFSNSNGANPGQARIYSFWIKDAASGLTILDLIAVRFTNEFGQSEGAMYDRVSGALFRNAGTGAFRFGTDIAGGGING